MLPIEMMPVNVRVSLTKGASSLHVGDRQLVPADAADETRVGVFDFQCVATYQQLDAVAETKA